MRRIETLFSLTCVLLIVFTGYSKQDDFPVLRGPYLGQKPPGTSPKKFFTDELKAAMPFKYHFLPAFSQDGNKMCWAHDGEKFQIFFSETIDGKWIKPYRPSFVSDDNENSPLFSLNGEAIYYLSFKKNGYIFEVKRTGHEWSKPIGLDVSIPPSLGRGWFFSISRNKTLFLELWKDGKPNIYKANNINNKYKQFDMVQFEGGENSLEMAPYINKDEQYLIFSSIKDNGFGSFDLYIAFRNSDDSWTSPINMGNKINTSSSENAAFVSLDERYLFFSRNGEIYWISAEIIEELRPDESK